MQPVPVRKQRTHNVFASAERRTIVLVTICTKDRGRWLAWAENHHFLRDIWTHATAWLAGTYTILPDHLHVFVVPGSGETALDAWVRYYKSQFSKAHRVAEHRWQTDFWDTRVQSDESYERKWEYVKNNPVRHGLVQHADEWPYQGVIHDIGERPAIPARLGGSLALPRQMCNESLAIVC